MLLDFVRAKDRLADYRQTFGSPHGKRVLYDLMNLGDVLNTTHVKGDAHTSAFREGKRALVCSILQKLNVKPEEFEKILKGDM